jgi:two-component system, response regulator / RNA-binding antiterminator
MIPSGNGPGLPFCCDAAPTAAMRILVLDRDPAAAARVADGLAGAEVRCCADLASPEAAAFAPDAVVLPAAALRQLQDDLEKARADLSARRDVERAKALVMRERGLDEEAAYRLLRKLSMDTGRPLGAVAADLLALAGVLKD